MTWLFLGILSAIFPELYEGFLHGIISFFLIAELIIYIIEHRFRIIFKDGAEHFFLTYGIFVFGIQKVDFVPKIF